MSKDDRTDEAKVISIWRTPRLIEDPIEKQSPSDDKEKLNNFAYNEARSEGYAAGMAAAKQETETNREMLNAYLKALSQPFEEQNSQLAESVASLAGKIAKNLVEKELCTNKESFMTIVQTAVNALGNSAKEIKIHVHPQSAEYIRESISNDDDKSFWEILDDPSMGIGDCKVSCDNSTVDSDLDDRIDLIIAQFLDDAREGGNG
ncbi:MAG: flagellar assembly protein FliH [Gammaproteobacteria bacterium]|nr:flagellar assembly protein FliH [Gammaproteobacteria bacterium]